MRLDVDLAEEQTQVAEHIGFGYSIKETAYMTGKPIDTVKSTLKVIYKKLEIQKATELSKYLYCRKFNISLSMCEPARRIIAVFFLALYIAFAYGDDDYYCRMRRGRRTNNRIERLARRRVES